MSYSNEQRSRIYDRTDGKCHLCHRKIAWKNYGVFGARGGWEVDHSRPRANGGTDHGNNLFAACISCNRSKQHDSTRAVRRANGVSRAPISAAERVRRRDRVVAGGGAGLAVGALFGPWGMIFGPLVGAALASTADDE
jgi:hypothetical protein